MCIFVHVIQLSLMYFLSEFNMPGAPLTKDEKNFWRLVRIMFEDVPGKLRGLFKSKFHEHFKLAWGDNQTSGEFFLANSNIRHTCHRVIDVIKQGDTAQYDFTALFTCLLFSGCGNGILLRSLKCCVNELREMRHDLAHASSASLTHASFVKKLTSLNVAYAQLQWNPTVMRQWARNPMVTAKCIHLQRQLDAERQRYTSLDLIVPDLDRTVQETAGMGCKIYKIHFVDFFFQERLKILFSDQLGHCMLAKLVRW